MKSKVKSIAVFGALLWAACYGAAASADVNVGVIVSATGRLASLGLPEKNTVPLMATTIAGQKVNYIVLDDESDPGNAAKNAQKLIQENKVDVIIGSSTTPASLAAARVAVDAKTPIIALAPITLAPEVKPWTFFVPQSSAVMAEAVIRHMKQAGIKTIGYIGYSDSYGDDWWRNLSAQAEAGGIKIVAAERFARADNSVTGQVLKVVSANPQAVFIGASGTPSALPQATLLEQGYKGKIYQSHGSANQDYLRVAGKNAEGTVLPVGPVLVAEQLADSHPAKKPGLDFLKRYEGAYGAGNRNTFGAHMYDAVTLLEQAIPVALKTAKPGTAEFREALRAALDGQKEVPASHGVFNLAKDHNGLDQRAVVLVKVENGAWVVIK